MRDGWSRNSPGHTKHAGGWILDKRLAPGFLERHTLIAPDGTVHDRRRWQWAEVDAPRSRIVFAEAGRICSVPVRHPLRDPKVLFDANGMTFEPLEAPY